TGTMEKLTGIPYSKEDVTLPAAKFTAPDETYTFAYWTKDAAGKEERYVDQAVVSKLGGSKRDNENIRLYAQWKGKPYTIDFDGTFPDAQGSVDQQTCYYGLWDRLTTQTDGLTRHGSTLVGWARTKADAEKGFTDYNLGDQILDLPDEGKSSITLYAVWTEQINVTAPINPTIKIDAQGKLTADTATFFESNTSKSVTVTHATCTPIAGAQGTIAVFPQESQWPNIAITLESTTGTTSYVFLNGLTFPLQGLSVPARSGTVSGKLPVSVNLLLNGADISYTPNAAQPVAQIMFTFERGA
ncbi:MAG: InlB B-repeat-containing protein, partial [Raoultibacter sp.]